ncbi:MAG: AAA-like domain-containing protein [Cyanobacteria bacterium J06554_1]
MIPAYRPVQIGSTEAFKLHSMGLVRYDGNSVVPLCGLYRQYFQSRL